MKAAWLDGLGCVITHTDNKVLAATFIYSMCFDLTVLILSAVKLMGRRGASQIVKLLFQDGLIFFMIAYVHVLSVKLHTVWLTFCFDDIQVHLESHCYDLHGHELECYHERHLQCARSHRVYGTSLLFLRRNSSISRLTDCRVSCCPSSQHLLIERRRSLVSPLQFSVPFSCADQSDITIALVIAVNSKRVAETSPSQATAKRQQPPSQLRTLSLRLRPPASTSR